VAEKGSRKTNPFDQGISALLKESRVARATVGIIAMIVLAIV